MVGSFSTLKSISYKQASLCTSSREERNCFSQENHTQAHRGNQTTVVLMAYTGILTNGLMPAAYLLGSPAHEEMAGWQTTATLRLHTEHLELMTSLLRIKPRSGSSQWKTVWALLTTDLTFH